MEYKSRINDVIDDQKELDEISGTDSLVLSEINSDDAELVTIGISHRKELKNGKILRKIKPGKLIIFHLKI